MVWPSSAPDAIARALRAVAVKDLRLRSLNLIELEHGKQRVHDVGPEGAIARAAGDVELDESHLLAALFGGLSALDPAKRLEGELDVSRARLAFGDFDLCEGADVLAGLVDAVEAGNLFRGLAVHGEGSDHSSFSFSLVMP